ncbi:MAG: transporter substrate-binding domain-containing protein [Burkholderiaceae bacterium]|nr:transporter substrate-binding domain-containing protein [Burkholderiaceae bacterium]
MPGLSGALWLCCVSFNACASESIRACAANLEYPPYLFIQHDTQGGSLVGLTIDTLQASLKRVGKPPAKIEKLPWLRCLKLVEVGDIDVALNVPTAQIDPKPYRISEPYAVVHSVYIASRINSPHGLKIRTVEDLKKYRICGLLGIRYDSYGIDTGTVDAGSGNYLSLINKLNAGHCDLFLEKREIMDGLQARSQELRTAFNSSSLVQTPLPEDSPLGLHFAVSRRIQDSEALLEQINAGIAILKRTGQLNKWMPSYLKQK